MEQLGKYIVFAGSLLLLLGGLLWLLGRLGFRGLPGDFHYESDGVSIHFPIVTCLVLSLLATGLLWLWRWISHR